MYAFTAFLVGVASFAAIWSAQPVQADQYDDKITALQADIARYQAEADRLAGESQTLQNAVSQLANEKAAIQTQIDINQAQYDQLVKEIAETEKKVQDNRDALGTTIADLYVNSKTSPLEMLASSSNVSDYLNQQEYQTSIRDQLTSTIKEIKKLKQELEDKKTEVDKVLSSQKSARDELAAREAQQQELLNKTQSDEATYQSLISSGQQAINDAKATQALIRARLNSTGGYTLVNMGSYSSYPWNSSNCQMVYADLTPGGPLSHGGADGDGHDGGADGIGSDGYGCRQCASYVAWRIAKEIGVYYYWGNGNTFDDNAIAEGYQSLGQDAQPGSIAVMEGAPYGHVAWVEAVSGDQVLVSQYNYNYGAGWGMYSEMWLSKYAFDVYVKIK